MLVNTQSQVISWAFRFSLLCGKEMGFCFCLLVMEPGTGILIWHASGCRLKQKYFSDFIYFINLLPDENSLFKIREFLHCFFSKLSSGSKRTGIWGAGRCREDRSAQTGQLKDGFPSLELGPRTLS